MYLMVRDPGGTTENMENAQPALRSSVFDILLDWLIDWIVFYAAFNSISVISRRQLTLFMYFVGNLANIFFILLYRFSLFSSLLTKNCHFYRAWLIVLFLAPFAILFQVHRGGQYTCPRFPQVYLISNKNWSFSASFIFHFICILNQFLTHFIFILWKYIYLLIFMPNAPLNPTPPPPPWMDARLRSIRRIQDEAHAMGVFKGVVSGVKLGAYHLLLSISFNIHFGNLTMFTPLSQFLSYFTLSSMDSVFLFGYTDVFLNSGEKVTEPDTSTRLLKQTSVFAYWSRHHYLHTKSDISTCLLKQIS